MATGEQKKRWVRNGVIAVAVLLGTGGVGVVWRVADLQLDAQRIGLERERLELDKARAVLEKGHAEQARHTAVRDSLQDEVDTKLRAETNLTEREKLALDTERVKLQKWQTIIAQDSLFYNLQWEYFALRDRYCKETVGTDAFKDLEYQIGVMEQRIWDVEVVLARLQGRRTRQLPFIIRRVTDLQAR
jgi:hypothetical protein